MAYLYHLQCVESYGFLNSALTEYLLILCSTRVSNALGAGDPNAAQLATMTVMVLGATEAIIAVSVLYCCRNVLGYAFGYEKEVVDYVKSMTPIICLSMIMDSLQAVVSGNMFTQTL